MAIHKTILWECLSISSIFHSPATTTDAKAIYHASKMPIYLSGGQEMVVRLKNELTDISDVIDLSNIEALHGICVKGSTLSIGAGESHAAIAESALVAQTAPVLCELASGIGDPQTRNKGTIGGATASKIRFSDWSAALLGLDATIHTTEDSHAAENYFSNGGLLGGELITKICFEIPYKGVYLKQTRVAATDAVVGVFVSRFEDRSRVAIAGVNTVAFRCRALESALRVDFSKDAYHHSYIPKGKLLNDASAGLEYRLNLIEILCKRAISICA